VLLLLVPSEKNKGKLFDLRVRPLKRKEKEINVNDDKGDNNIIMLV
jgi:hypothetical protein